MSESMYKFIAGMAGGIIGLLTPIIPLVVVCFLFVIADMWSAFQLEQRIHQKLKKDGKLLDKDSGKFKTCKAKKIFKTMTDIAALILLSYLLDIKVLEHLNGLSLANYVAGLFCILQVWSMLENTSSCNGSSWAKVLQKIMVDKTKRHFDIDLNELKSDKC